MSDHTICLVGNPNCGKTTLFNALTGTRQQVGNWPGVTVERKTGSYRSNGRRVSVVDLPGVYSLTVTSVSSLDERIARDFVLSGEAHVVVNILDASNLERNLYLTTQLLEMRVPMLVALNMLDAANDRRIKIDVEGLAERLGCPVVPMVASRGEGVDRLKGEIDRVAANGLVPSVELGYTPEVEDAITSLLPSLTSLDLAGVPNNRWLAIKLLEGDNAARALVPAAVLAEAERIAEHVWKEADEDSDILIADGRYGLANALIRETVTREGVVHRTVSDRIDRVVLHRMLGIPIFLAVMYLLFLFTINLGGAFIDFFDQFVGTLLVDGGGALMTALGSPDWLTTALAGGVGGGILAVSPGKFGIAVVSPQLDPETLKFKAWVWRNHPLSFAFVLWPNPGTIQQDLEKPPSSNAPRLRITNTLHSHGFAPNAMTDEGGTFGPLVHVLNKQVTELFGSTDGVAPHQLQRHGLAVGLAYALEADRREVGAVQQPEAWPVIAGPDEQLDRDIDEPKADRSFPEWSRHSFKLLCRIGKEQEQFRSPARAHDGNAGHMLCSSVDRRHIPPRSFHERTATAEPPRERTGRERSAAGSTRSRQRS
jgi:small GTP-binding protein